MKADAISFWELPDVIVGVSPKSGSTSFARAFPRAKHLDPRTQSGVFRAKSCVYYMRNPISRLVSAYKFFLTHPDNKNAPDKETMEKFSSFVNHCASNDNKHWNSVYPCLQFVHEIRDFSNLKELVGEHWENKSDPISVYMNHDTMARIAYCWAGDIEVYNAVLNSATVGVNVSNS